MIDPELKGELEKINTSLVKIFHKQEGAWKAFFRGLMHGMGTVVGIVVAILAIGWILNAIGVIPGFTKQAKELKSMWQQTLDEAQRIK